MEKIVVIFGPTAVGKTKFATKLANYFDGEIISADSRQVYKNLDLGTGKDLADYQIGEKAIPYHLIDIANLEEEYDLFRFISDFNIAAKNILNQGKTPFLVGGTSMFLHSIFKNYQLVKTDFLQAKILELEKTSDEELRNRLFEKRINLHNQTDLLDRKRIIKAILIAESDSGQIVEPIELKKISICILPEREIIHSRIKSRLKFRFENGMLKEVEDLLKSGISYEKLNILGLEYRFISKYLKGEISYNDMFQKLDNAIREFAKKQTTWIRKFQKEGIDFALLEEPNFEQAVEIIENGFKN